jgi:uncharacterized membrane protein YjgN (DUF898 family)
VTDGLEPPAEQPTIEAPSMAPAAPRVIEAPPILAPPILVPPEVSEPVTLERLTFTGTGSEYFRIWIVNLALTIATLGLYSAWAKVRRLQFFYRHTRLAGAGFDYHGDPIAILKGRIVGLVLFGLYSSMGYAGTWLTLVIVIVLGALLPWLLGRSLRFRLHNSSYRGLRFKFHGTTRQAYWVFLCLPAFTLLSLLTLGPFWHHRIKRYQFTNAAYGQTRFRFNAEPGQFYGAYIISAAIVMMFFGGLVMLIVVVAAGTAGAEGAPPQDTENGPLMAALVPVILFVYVIAIVAGQAISRARIQNAVWNKVRLARIGFISELSMLRLFIIILTNLFATVLTLGLFRPFGQVRLARYVAGCFAVAQVTEFGDFIAADTEDVTATGEETAELFDLDIGF